MVSGTGLVYWWEANTDCPGSIEIVDSYHPETTDLTYQIDIACNSHFFAICKSFRRFWYVW